jgi:4a-hydroxytetrahydrobiopterin dehydratase
MSRTRLTADEFATFEGLDDWRYVLGAIRATYRAGGSFTSAAELAGAIATLADEADHHPDIDVRYPDVVAVSLTTFDAGGLTTNDVDLARAIANAAGNHGATAEPTAQQRLEIAIDTMDADRIRPFWRAVLGYVDDGTGALVDPRRIGPAVWFQQMDEPRPQRDRFHIDVSVAHDAAEARIAQALDAGGRLVNDSSARAFWVLADADGNEACVCTWQDRNRT